MNKFLSIAIKQLSNVAMILFFWKRFNRKQKLYFEVGLGALLVVLVLSEPEALRAGGPSPLHNNFLFLPLSIGHFVYLLKSLKDGNYYIGQTDDVQGRLKKHNLGQVKSTKSRRPFILVGYEEQATRNEARWREYELKHHSDKKEAFIKKLG